MSATLPVSARWAQWLLLVSIALTGLWALLASMFSDELVVAWARGNAGARPVYEQGGLNGLKNSSINIPDFPLLALVMFITFASLALVLLMLFRAGFNWARICLTLLAVFGMAVAVRAIMRGLPLGFLALSAFSLCVYVALIVCFWRPDTGSHFRHD